MPNKDEIILSQGQLRNIRSYLKFLDATAIPATTIGLGKFYSYWYKFDTNVDYDELKFYDYFPLVYAFGYTKNGFYGLNFHHLPPKARQIWLSRIIDISPDNFDKEGETQMPYLDCPSVYRIMIKSKIGVRRYRYDRLNTLRVIERQHINNTMKFVAKTYFNVGINQIRARYLNYRPKQ
jgi:hypothetical protein